MLNFEDFQSNLAGVQERIATACSQSGRALEEVSLLPVTKNHPLDAVKYAKAAGLRAVGENRVQEAADKRSSYASGMRWELIGHLQSNKARLAVETFERIQSVDSLKLIRKLDRHASDLGKVLPVLIQCNSGEDPGKYGFPAESMNEAIEAALSAESLSLEGLMTIAPLDKNPDAAKAAFEKLRELRDILSARHDCLLPELSMGMTGDMELAIAAGSTQIRVGTALYGSRNPKAGPQTCLK